MKIPSIKVGQSIPREVLLVLFLGFVIRLFAWHYTAIINPDGTYYLHQAKALYYGHWTESDIVGCGRGYLSLYPVLITGAYCLLHDWVTAARAISYLFGGATLLPLYLLLRSFFDEKISLLTLLIFALTPIFVSGSADLIRDPLFWFFLVLGLLFFVKQMEKDHRLYLFMSAFSFMLAISARMEAIPFIFLSGLFILFTKRGKKIQNLALFLSPFIFVILLWASLTTIWHKDFSVFLGMHDIVARVSMPLVRYQQVGAVLSDLLTASFHVTAYPYSAMYHFLEEAKNGMWLVGIGTLLNRACEAFFYPFFFVTLVGLVGFTKEIRRDHRILYLSMLIVCSLAVLYVEIIFMWVLAYRYLAAVIIPSFIFTGFGAKRIIDIFQQRFGFRESTALTIGVFLILASGLPKNLMPREYDKIVFKEIGEFISDREGGGHAVGVSTSYQTPGWVSFYANGHYSGIQCGRRHDYGTSEIRKGNKGLFTHLRQLGTKYLLREEKFWPEKVFDLRDTPDGLTLKELGRWHHRDTGKMVLYEVIWLP
jgi:4-amino-4-deoxy-L-arabinose transferase-like glycosyltransferase